jgi:hypothetical protein
MQFLYNGPCCCHRQSWTPVWHGDDERKHSSPIQTDASPHMWNCNQDMLLLLLNLPIMRLYEPNMY